MPSLPVWEEWIEINHLNSSFGRAQSLPVWEEWIEISGLRSAPPRHRSLPVWEEWIEMKRTSATWNRPASLPVWEEWIEIVARPDRFHLGYRLFPYGKSGLKCGRGHERADNGGSLPVWEEWIEIKARLHENEAVLTSLPVWEEWIEIVALGSALSVGSCLFPYGKSGLKFNGDPVNVRRPEVSSRMGRVD